MKTLNDEYIEKQQRVNKVIAGIADFEDMRTLLHELLMKREFDGCSGRVYSAVQHGKWEDEVNASVSLAEKNYSEMFPPLPNVV